MLRLRAMALGDEDDARTSTSQRSALNIPLTPHAPHEETLQRRERENRSAERSPPIRVHAPHEETLRERVLRDSPPLHAPHEETLRERILGRAWGGYRSSRHRHRYAS